MNAAHPEASAVAARLSKRKVLVGLHCHRRAWLACNEPARATEPDARRQREAGSPLDLEARRLFPGGRPISHPYWAHTAAMAATRAQMADPNVPALFEAAFEHDGVRIRVDVLERLGPERWGLRAVKATPRVKEIDIDDLALQACVLAGCGLDVASIELIHVDPRYARAPEGVDWERLFVRADCTRAVTPRLFAMAAAVGRLQQVIDRRMEPAIEPGHHCKEPWDCEFWAWCTRGKPSDWIFMLPNLGANRFEALSAAGVERIVDIPDDVKLTDVQARVRRCARSGSACVAERLSHDLEGFGPPAWYLDFESSTPVVPRYPGTHPFQTIPVQWSLQRLDAEGGIEAVEFRADGCSDPRRPLAEALVEALGGDDLPVVVYSHFERTRLAELSSQHADLEAELDRITGRLADLLPVVRRNVYLPAFGGSFSLEAVARALAPGLRWEGGGITRRTRALLEVHQALRALSPSPDPSD